jgi:hypothetical protein
MEIMLHVGNAKVIYITDVLGVSKNTWKGKSNQKKMEWECINCRTPRSRLNSNPDNEPTDPTYVSLKRLLENMFQKQEKAIIERIDGLTAIVTEVREKYEEITKEVKEVTEKTTALRKDIDELKVALECEGQYGTSKNFIITSIPTSQDEDVGEKVDQLLSAMNIQIRKEEFTAHRLPANNQTPAIIVQCSTRATRDSIVQRARKFKPNLSLIYPNVPQRAIYFNDNLTPYFANLMMQAKRIKREKGYKFLWLNGNRIMLKKDESSRAIRIVKEGDFQQVK